MVIIKTERLILRSWRESDAECLYRICLDSELQRAGTIYFRSIEESRGAVRHWAKLNVALAVVHRADDKVIGFVNLGDMNRYECYMELEYAIACDYRNKGYATEALRRLLAYAFDELNLLVIAAWVRSHNIKSVRVLEKCGFTHEGTLRKHARDQSDTLCYSILQEDWATIKEIISFNCEQ